MQERITILLSEMDPDQSGIVFMECLRVNEDLNRFVNIFKIFKMNLKKAFSIDLNASKNQDQRHV